MNVAAGIWILTVVYLGALVVIGILTSKRAGSSFSEYAIGGKQVPYVLLFFTFIATVFGVGNFVGHADKGAQVGLAWLPYIWGEQGGKIVVALTIAAVAAKYSFSTMAEFLENLVVKDRMVRALAGILLSLIGIAWTGAQAMGIGSLYQIFTGADPTLIVILSSIVFIFYTVAGGVMAVIWSDLIQGIMIVIFGIAFYIGSFSLIDFNLANLGAKAAEVSPELWSFTGVSSIGILTLFLTALMAQFTQQVTWQRFFAAKDPRQARSSYLWTAILAVTFVSLTAITGIIAKVYMPEVQSGTSVALVKEFFPWWVQLGMFLLVAGATLSTADSYLNSAAINITNDVIIPYFPNLAEKSKILIARVVTICVGLVSIIGTMKFKYLIDYVAFGYSICGATLFPLLVLGLWWRKDKSLGFSAENSKITPIAAKVALIGGALVTLYFELTPSLKSTWGGGVIPGSLVTAGLLVIISLFSEDAKTKAEMSAQSNSR